MGDRARVPGKFPDDVFPSFQKDDDAPDAKCDDDDRRASKKGDKTEEDIVSSSFLSGGGGGVNTMREKGKRKNEIEFNS